MKNLGHLTLLYRFRQLKEILVWRVDCVLVCWTLACGLMLLCLVPLQGLASISTGRVLSGVIAGSEWPTLEARCVGQSKKLVLGRGIASWGLLLHELLLQTLIQALDSVWPNVDEILLLNWMLKWLLKQRLGVWRESLLAMGSLRLHLDIAKEIRVVAVVLKVKHVVWLRENKVATNVHQACYPFQEVGRRSSSNDHSSIMGYDLLLLSTVV